MKAEHGIRFSHVSHNAATILTFFDELVIFADLDTNSVKLQQLNCLVRDNADKIKNELQALACRHTSLQLIHGFTDFAKKIQEQSSL
jgi:hypothetical protein